MTDLRDKLQQIATVADSVRNDQIAAMDFSNTFGFYASRGQFPFMWRGVAWDRETAEGLIKEANARGRKVATHGWWEHYQR